MNSLELTLKELFLLEVYDSLNRVIRNTDQAPIDLKLLSDMSGIGLINIMAAHGIVFAFKHEVQS